MGRHGASGQPGLLTPPVRSTVLSGAGCLPGACPAGLLSLAVPTCLHAVLPGMGPVP